MRTTLLWTIALPMLSWYLPAQDISLGRCRIFPEDNVWNTPVDKLPLDPNSNRYVETIGAARNLHPDFGAGLYDGGRIGIPYVSVPGDQAKFRVKFEYGDESDWVRYPIPPNPPIEAGSDAHILMVDRDNCVLYELYAAKRMPDGTWEAGSGAVYDLTSHGLRPADWTSADAAGLPILPGLARYDEVAAGEIRHALRFTVPQSRREYLWPARHYASRLTEERFPPMGQRFRLKAGFDIAGFSPETQVILRALKRYGMILADNGSPWFISGVPDDRWNNSALAEIKRLKGSDFEAVDSSDLMITPHSGRVWPQFVPPPPPAAPTVPPTPAEEPKP